MSNFADRITNLSPEKRVLLARLLASQKSEQAAAQRIQHREQAEDGVVPLSFTQERLWFLDQLLPGTTMYNMAGAARVHGPLDETVVLDVFEEIVRRHEPLRTTFRTVDGKPVAHVHQEARLAPKLVDLSDTPAAETEMETLVAAEVRRPFDLARGPLLRFTLYRLRDTEHVGLLTMHHIIADGISTQILFQEFAALYAAFLRGASSPLPPLPVVYSDYAAWQHDKLQGEEIAQQLVYWKEQFEGGVPVLDLPTDHPRPAVPTHGGGRQPLYVPPALTRQLQALSRDEGVTLFMTLLAAFKTLLYRYTGAREVVVGIPVAGRIQPELESLIGCFLNMLALRTDMQATLPFRALLERIKTVALGGYAHQELPFEKLVEELQPERTLSQAPLAQVAFSFEEDPASALRVADLVFTFEEVETGASKLDLGLELTAVQTETGETALEGWIEYSTDLFLPETVNRMASHLLVLLRGIVADPTQPIALLPLLTTDERQTVVDHWNETDAPYPMDVCLHNLFEAQAQATPEAIALFCGEYTLSYRELNEQANQVAHYLRALGVGPESLVGLCLERSPAMIVAVFGILKAGGAYVPLDASHPESRLEFMIEDAQGSVVVTQEQFVERLPQKLATLVCMDRDWPAITKESTANVTSGVDADNLAYVLYTSGSTGQPKGVTVPHRDIVHHTLAFAEVQALTPDDRMLMFVSLLFDAAAAALYPPLSCGAAVVLPAAASSELSSQDTLQLCQRYDVTIVHQPASYWHQWVDDLDAIGEPFESKLRIMMTGGEVPSINKLRNWTRLLGRPSHFFNAYGPTEAVITITLYEVDCRPEVVDTLTRMPAGRPIPNKRVYLLDRYQQPVPIGVPGEVYVGGIGLARNYLNRPAQTAQKFVPDPFSERPGGRLYRTSDLARYLPDGDIEFLTRADEQLKIRGYRIEPGDVESALLSHPAVLESLVMGWRDPAGRLRLVAYLVAQGDVEPPPAALRDHLKQYLPDYMLPSAFVFLERIPLTDLGKADRRALPPPTWERVEEIPFMAPQSPTEETLATIWKEVLGIEQVGRHDNFFDLGGDSILSMQIVSRANQAGLHLAPRQIFQHQTVAELAAVVTEVSQVVAEQGPVGGSVLLTPIQQWFFGQELPEPWHWNQAIWLEACQSVEVDRLAQAVDMLVQHHDALRLRFIQDERGQWHQEHATPDEVNSAFSHVDLDQLTSTAQEEQLQVIAAQAQRTLNLEDGPLFQIILFDFGTAQPARLLLLAHHLVIDGVSWRVLVEDLHAAYEAAPTTAESSAILPSKSTSFQQWAQQLAAYAAQEETAMSERFHTWTATLPQDVASLPVDMEGGVNEESTAATVSVVCDVATTRALLQEAAPAYHMNVAEVLLAALAPVLATWTGDRGVAVQLEGHGRGDLFAEMDLSRTVGWFTTSYPSWLPAPEGEVDSLLKAVKEAVRHVPGDQEYGLLRYMTNSDAWRAAPTPQISFNYLGQLDQGVDGGSLFKLLPQSPSALRSALGHRSFLIDINSFVAGGELHIAWTYSHALHQPETIERLAQLHQEQLETILAHCYTLDGSQYTPSDFPDVALKQEDLDAVLAEIGL